MLILRKNEATVPISDFPSYEITNYGRVFNINTGREMTLSPTQNGDLTVGLVRDHRQYRYSVKGLVARTFVPGETEIFNTPVLLDGDKHNLYFMNIVWRPRWFAWNYTREFSARPTWHYFGPILERTDKKTYKNYVEASLANGILCADIRRSIYQGGRPVFPTGQEFAYSE